MSLLRVGVVCLRNHSTKYWSISSETKDAEKGRDAR